MKKIALFFLPLLLLTACATKKGPTVIIDQPPSDEVMQEPEEVLEPEEDYEAAPEEVVCPKEEKPVCGKIHVLCVAEPCNPVPKTFRNFCEAEKVGAMDIRKGSCEDLELSDIDEVTLALIKKLKTEDVSLNVQSQSDRHMRAKVQVPDEAPSTVLATRVGDEWTIVFEGNGDIDCSMVINYGFPMELFEDCKWPE